MAAVETTGVIGEAHKRTYLAGVAGMQRGVAVMQGADDNHVVPATANAQCLGILEESTFNVGDAASVVDAGEAVYVAGAAIVAPAFLISNATGQLVPSAAIGDQVIIRAISSSSSAGDYGVGRLTPFIR